MSGMYIAKQGDCLSSIAAHFGLKSYHSIYDHPNNADFKKKRPNPNLLFPGDSLYIPDLKLKEHDCPTDRLHEFCVARPLVKLRIKLLDHERKPYKYKKYKIAIDSSPQTWSGHTTAKGLLEALIPANVTAGKLQLWLTDDPDTQASIEMPLQIGNLDPAEEVTGVQARLNHLGFHCGAVDGILGPKTRSALTRFQKQHELSETGNIDGPTRDKLFQLHDKE
jgi:Putative peptidoglycan binding domain